MPYPHQFITLTPEELEKITIELKRLALQSKWKKRRKLQALYFSNMKVTFSDIAKNSRVHYTTVRRWVYRYQKDGLENFIRWLNRPGFGKGKRP